ncbi:hypothetical protein [Haloferax sp. Atlit-4N]|uniref:hypothetical protein n=1 Tax=Haloferax sp. Atlit-4N TaxID=2077206 RepID=UPI0011C05C57|nr:hypothetical protein [Haloferax sp. Atlit-4N]
MTLFILFSILLSAIILKRDFRGETDRIIAFVDDYRTSTVYWSSSFVGGLLGTASPSSWKPYSTAVVGGIFLLPVFSYYYLKKPFGIYCEYRPVDPEEARVDMFAESNQIVELTQGEETYDIDLKFTSDKHINQVKVRLRPPEGSEIYFVDPVEGVTFNQNDNRLTIKMDGGEEPVIGVYVQPLKNRLSTSRTHEFRVVEEHSGETIEKVTLKP